ncbi:MAG: porin, partial [Betaproteobacteria bacterium]|nr:porin [Betaproteobacteria bacterium]
MQKKVIALAVAGALGAPALAYAQTSTVQIYGKVNAEYAYIDEGGSRNTYDRVFNPGSSAIGFRGEEKLGGGLSAWFQCESEFNIQGTGLPLCRRNSAVGLKGGFGNIFFGNWDTPYKQTSAATYRPFDTTGYLGVGSILHNETTTAANGTVTTITTNVVVAATGVTAVNAG